MILVDGVLGLPYHLAIHDHWKVHHFRTDMGNQHWMQDEEAAFLDDPAAVFTEPHRRRCTEIARISRARVRRGRLLDRSPRRGRMLAIFEVNASMLIHDDNADYAYKTPHVTRIKATFDAMLARRALAARLAAVAQAPRVAETRIAAAG